jgi:hypothetical protein
VRVDGAPEWAWRRTQVVRRWRALHCSSAQRAGKGAAAAILSSFHAGSRAVRHLARLMHRDDRRRTNGGPADGITNQQNFGIWTTASI